MATKPESKNSHERCVMCGGPIQKDNTVGICCTTSPCRKERGRLLYHRNIDCIRTRQRERHRAKSAARRQRAGHCTVCKGELYLGNGPGICGRTARCRRERDRYYYRKHVNRRLATKRSRYAAHREHILQRAAYHRYAGGSRPPDKSRGQFSHNWSGGKMSPCDYCDQFTWRDPSKLKACKHRFCSNICYRAWQHANPKERGKVYECAECKKSFRSINYQPQFCSRLCYAKNRSTRGRVECSCEYCGTRLYKKRAEYANRAHHFCSNRCRAAKSNNTVECFCDYCDTRISKTKNQWLRAEHHFCSKQCQTPYMAKHTKEKRNVKTKSSTRKRRTVAA